MFLRNPQKILTNVSTHLSHPRRTRHKKVNPVRISNSKLYHYTRLHTFSPATTKTITFWDVTSNSLVRVQKFQSNLPHLPSDPPAHIYQTTQRHIPEYSDLRIMIIRCFRKPRLLTQWRLDTGKVRHDWVLLLLTQVPGSLTTQLGVFMLFLSPPRQIL